MDPEVARIVVAGGGHAVASLVAGLRALGHFGPPTPTGWVAFGIPPGPDGVADPAADLKARA